MQSDCSALASYCADLGDAGSRHPGIFWHQDPAAGHSQTWSRMCAMALSGSSKPERTGHPSGVAGRAYGVAGGTSGPIWAKLAVPQTAGWQCMKTTQLHKQEGKPGLKNKIKLKEQTLSWLKAKNTVFTVFFKLTQTLASFSPLL